MLRTEHFALWWRGCDTGAEGQILMDCVTDQALNDFDHFDPSNGFLNLDPS